MAILGFRCKISTDMNHHKDTVLPTNLKAYQKISILKSLSGSTHMGFIVQHLCFILEMLELCFTMFHFETKISLFFSLSFVQGDKMTQLVPLKDLPKEDTNLMIH